MTDDQGLRQRLEALLAGDRARRDERIVRFVQDYLRLREPDSPYQEDRRVTDPVCGMTLRRAEAAATLEHGGRTYHFCAPECRERFAADPERFITALGRPAGRL